MKRCLTLAVVLVGVLMILTPSFGQGPAGRMPGHQPSAAPLSATSLQGTTWEGDLSVVDTTGTITTVGGAIVSVLTQTNSLISGTITDPNNSANTLSFSGVIHPAGPVDLQITAPDMLIRANVMKMPASITTTGVMNLAGSDLSKGTSFTGQLTQQ